MNIGTQIKFYREQMGWSQKELAEKIFVSERTIGHYETETRFPPIDKLMLIANVLEVELNDLTEKSKKEPKDWYQSMIEPVLEEKRKAMDKERFCLFLKRIGEYKNVVEDENGVHTEMVSYSKQLEKLLSKLSNERIVFTTAFHQKNNFWTIIGYIGNNRFTLDIASFGEDILFRCCGPLYEGQFLSSEMKNIVTEIYNWVKTENPNKSIFLDIETLLYLGTMSKDELLELEIRKEHLPDEFSYQAPFGIFKHENIYTLKDLLESKGRTDSISMQNFFYAASDLFHKVDAYLREYPFFSVEKLLTKNMLIERYPNLTDIPLKLVDVDAKVLFPFIHKGYVTLGEVATLFKEDAEIIYGMYGLNKINELTNLLSSFDLNLKK